MGPAEDVTITYKEYMKVKGNYRLTCGPKLCPFTDKFPFGISECNCQLSFAKNDYKSIICNTIKNRLSKLNLKKLVYVSLGSGKLLSDFKVLELINSGILYDNLEVHLIDKQYFLKEGNKINESRAIFLVDWLQQDANHVEVYFYKTLEDYKKVCDSNSESKANVFTVFDLGYIEGQTEKYDYKLVANVLKEHCLVSFLGYVENKNYPYFDVCEYIHNNFEELKVYDSRQDYKHKLKVVYRYFKNFIIDITNYYAFYWRWFHIVTTVYTTYKIHKLTQKL